MTARLQAIPALLAVALALTLPRAATAVDGVIEINQARALAGSVTATDTPGFPVTIDRSGSYRFTGNLSVSGGHNGIELTQAAGDVVLDLNGFSLVDITPGQCSCTGVSSSAGIARISNGSIRNFKFGISGDQLRVTSMRMASSLAWGTGISGGNYSVITDSTVGPHEKGIVVGGSSLVRGCTVVGNGLYGVATGGGSLVSGNNVSGSIHGIHVEGGSTVTGNNVHQNTYGIEAAAGATVLDNTILGNYTMGIVFTGTSGYGRNVVTFPNGDANPMVSGPGIEIGTNICGTDTVCP